MELWNFKGKQNSITEALRVSIPEHAVISVVGAGGKTSLIFSWARELAAAGKRIAVTTTAHMADPIHQGDVCCCNGDSLYDSVSLIYEDDDAADTCSMTDKAMVEGLIAFVMTRDDEKPGKVKSPSDAVLAHLRKTADVILIEADGSRRMPLKWPAPWEPVIPEDTDITVCVAGLSAVGRPAQEVIYRYDDIPDKIKKETVDVNLLHKMISSREGGQKGARGDFRVFLNQVDNDIDRLAAAYRLQQILSVFGIQTAWGSLLAADTDNGPLEDTSESVAENGSPKNEPAALAGKENDLTLAVILEAAGNSTRFGSNKLLHIMDDGRPMASCIMDSVCYAIDMLDTPPGSRPVRFRKILVTQYEEVAELAPDYETVINDKPELGISLSMQLGIEAAGDADAYMFCVCDQPWLRPETICRLIHAYKNGTAGIVSLAWQGKMCNPKIFSSKYRDELMSLSGDMGGRQIIAGHKDELMLVEAQDEAEVRDIDIL